ncbi:hypothetical protein L873DRAFT_1821870 [Choiromyces venosus 120613-1]|uniref:Uncharacterized protein n=1 Tax=Choiromyces venosus 120613-1 TaxID=1336337 RepID=A0A3N4IVL2_9PEZI|nr:hypothetical protein L873DRAFT_1821870 [Choiromyces venosus 120613-1]
MRALQQKTSFHKASIPGSPPVNQLNRLRSTGQGHTMLTPHMGNKITISLDPPFANVLTPGHRKMEPFVKVHHFIVPVESLSRLERTWPCATGRITSEGTMRASVWATVEN